MVDVVVAMIAVPLLVVFSLMLQNNMRSDWLHDIDTRWRILGLGLSLLFVSLVVCLYVTHRLGLCIWAAQQNQESNRRTPDRRRISHRGPVSIKNMFMFLFLFLRTEFSFSKIKNFQSKVKVTRRKGYNILFLYGELVKTSDKILFFRLFPVFIYVIRYFQLKKKMS